MFETSLVITKAKNNSKNIFIEIRSNNSSSSKNSYFKMEHTGEKQNLNKYANLFYFVIITNCFICAFFIGDVECKHVTRTNQKLKQCRYDNINHLKLLFSCRHQKTTNNKTRCHFTSHSYSNI